MLTGRCFNCGADTDDWDSLGDRKLNVCGNRECLRELDWLARVEESMKRRRSGRVRTIMTDSVDLARLREDEQKMLTAAERTPAWDFAPEVAVLCHRLVLARAVVEAAREVERTKRALTVAALAGQGWDDALAALSAAEVELCAAVAAHDAAIRPGTRTEAVE